MALRWPRLAFPSHFLQPIYLSLQKTSMETIPAQTASEYWRYLGMVQNADGDIKSMLEGLTAEIAEAAEVLARSSITLAGAVFATILE